MLLNLKNRVTSNIDLGLLIAILLIMNASTSIKLVGLLVLFIYKPTIFKNFKSKEYPLFYLLMIGVILLQILFGFFDFDIKILKINIIALIIWGISLFVIVQLNKIVSDTEYKKIQNTVLLIFLINAIISCIELIAIMLETQTINPYTYHGMVLNQMTGMSMYGPATGDYIGGIFKTHSLHNAFFNVIGTVYFLINRKYIMSMICLVVLLMTTSNLLIIILFFTLISVVLFHSYKPLKYILLLHFLIVSIFYLKVSPDNLEYAERVITQSELKRVDNAILKKIKSQKEEEIKNQIIAKYINHRVTNDTTLGNNLKQNIKEKQIAFKESRLKKNKIKKNSHQTLSVTDSLDTDPITSIGNTTSKIIVFTNENSNRNLNNIIIANNKEDIIEGLENKYTYYDNVLDNFGMTKNSSTDTNFIYDKLTLNDQSDNTSAATLEKMEQFEVDLKTHQTNLRNKVIETYKDSISIQPPENLQKYPGKIISYIESIQHLTSSTSHFLIGSGPGQFSSKLAFGISGFSINDSGGKRFLNKQVEYISDDFKENHLKLFSYYWLKDPGEHSISHEPFSSYNQIIGEYGIIGFFSFIGFYVLFFLKRFKKLDAGKYLTVLMVLMLSTDYWFEHLNVIIIFELLILLDLKRIQYD